MYTQSYILIVNNTTAINHYITYIHYITQHNKHQTYFSHAILYLLHFVIISCTTKQELRPNEAQDLQQILRFLYQCNVHF